MTNVERERKRQQAVEHLLATRMADLGVEGEGRDYGPTL